MSDYLPNEVLIEILVKLPTTRSIIQCTSVCKRWYSLITSPNFISAHLKNQDDYLLVRHCSPTGETNEYFEHAKEIYALFCDNENFDQHTQFDFPLVCPTYFNIIGSCNGLLCLSDDVDSYNNSYYLWNPSIRKSVKLPRPIFTFWTHGPFDHTLGFGVDPVANDCKVVRVVHLDRQVPPRVELYKLSTGVWQDISHVAPSRKFFPVTPGVYVNGACHWVAREDYRNRIVLFDMHKEMFQEMMLPDCLVNEFYGYRGEDFVLFVSDDSLCFASTPFKNKKTIELWMMREYGDPNSWLKQFSISLQNVIFSTSVVNDALRPYHPFHERQVDHFLRKPIASRKNGEIFWRADNGLLVSYDPVAGKSKKLGICNPNGYPYEDALHVNTYKRSLILLGKRANSQAGNTCEESSSSCKTEPRGAAHDKTEEQKDCCAGNTCKESSNLCKREPKGGKQVPKSNTKKRTADCHQRKRKRSVTHQ